MKRFSKLLVLATFLLGWVLPSWSQAPSTEGRDFWVTFLRAADDDPTELKLTISARDSCEVLIENTNTGFSLKRKVGENSSTELTIAKANCYSSANETAKYTALHVSASKDISLFAGNYRDKSFDATNVLPTASLLDDYVIQTYPPSDHENKPQGSHFAIIAVEDGETVVDYTLPDGVQTAGNKTGTQTATLQKGQVWYVWTGKNEGEKADLSSTTVQARDKKKIAVFQGCPHTNIPYSVRDRDHIISQAMPTAYWGTEFGITASSHHRRDIVAVMALNDETKVYINDEKGNKQLVHTFDFNTDKKHYWTFEIGDSLAYCADNEGQSPSHGKLPYPLVIDSSCYLTTSCPAGVHLFMVSNRYDNAVEKVSSDTLISDPAMLWISPIEQVIKEINFSTYSTKQDSLHFMNILTTTGNVPTMEWNGQSIKQYFHKLRGNPDYSFARILIQDHHLDKDKLVNHNLKGELGFLAHVYGYGQRESYAYSCGSSTVERSISFNDDPLLIDSISSKIFCLNQDIEMKLNIGNNEYQEVIWDFGDGTTYSPDPKADNKEKKKASHSYNTPGWYDLSVKAVYINACTLKPYTETMKLSFLVKRPDTINAGVADVVSIKLEDYKNASAAQKAIYDDLVANGKNDTLWNKRVHCYDDVEVVYKPYCLETEEEKDTIKGQDQAIGYNGKIYYTSQDVVDTTSIKGCYHFTRYYVKVVTCLGMNVTNAANQHICPDEPLPIIYSKYKGDIKGDAVLTIKELPTFKQSISIPEGYTQEGKMDTLSVPVKITQPGYYHAQLNVTDLYCDPKSYPIDFAVYYPENLIALKFDNVLAVYKKGSEFNKSYVFSDFQWYLNGSAIPGANESVYYSPTPLKNGDTYSVEMTNQNGLRLPTCEMTVNYVFPPEDENNAPQKMLIDNRMVIVVDGVMYDMYGQRIN